MENTTKYTVLKFSAEAGWCSGCEQLKFAFESVKVQDNILIKSIDIDTEDGMKLAASYRVRSIPAMIVLAEDETEVKRKIGTLKSKELQEFFDSIGED